MKRPLTDRMNYLISLIALVIEDMNYLLETYPEQEAKPYIEILAEINKGYKQDLNALGERLKAQGGVDIEIGSDPPHFPLI